MEFRRRLLEAPQDSAADFLLHKRTCESCASAYRAAQYFEQRLKQSLMPMTPDDLASRILLKQAFRRDESARRKRWAFLGIAASVLIAVAGILAWPQSPPQRALSQEVVTLINEATHALVPQDPVQLEAIRAALRPAGVSIEKSIGVVTFASPCVVRGKLAGHLVLRGRLAPISVLLSPGAQLRSPQTVDAPDLHGLVVPSSAGTIAIVGAPGEELDELVEQLLSAVLWQA